MSETILEELNRFHVVVPDEVYGAALEVGGEGSLEMIDYLVEGGHVPKKVGCRIWSDRIGCAYVDPLASVVSDAAIASIPVDIARKGNLMPLYEIDGALTVAMPDPLNAALVDRLAAITNKRVSPVFCLSSEVRDAIELHYSNERTVQELIGQIEQGQGAILARLSPDELAGMSESKMIVGLCDALLFLAIKERASDIHVEPLPQYTNIRFRIDGRLQNLLTIASALHLPLKTRLKGLAQLNLRDTRFPQDGDFFIPLGTGTVTFRVSAVPTINGEKIVIRMVSLSGGDEFKSLGELSISQTILPQFKRVMNSPSGMVLISGPKSAGKSTTLYAMLHEINQPENNICTIEDPVELELEGVTQTQVDSNIDLKFPALLRSVLNQDTDIIMIGEIRDLETAKLAAEAALTGHLVLSSVHTSNAIQAIYRLIELGLEPFMVASALSAVMAQRLTARICENCRTAYSPETEVLENYFYDLASQKAPVFYRGSGCPHCRDSGYFGRIALHEMMLVTEEIRSLVSRRASIEDLSKAARKVGYRSLRYDGLKKVLLGYTTIDELEANASFDWFGSTD